MQFAEEKIPVQMADYNSPFCSFHVHIVIFLEDKEDLGLKRDGLLKKICNLCLIEY